MPNQLKTILLLGLLSAGLVALGAMLGTTWMIVAFIIAIALNVGGYFFSDRIVLRMHNAVEMSPEEFPRLHQMTSDLASKAKIPTPRLYLIPADYPNAFATGRNPEHGVVAVTEGLCRMLNERELRGVIAHEIAHIRNRDILIATMAAVLAAAITYIANFLQFSALFGSSADEDAPSPLAAFAFALVAPIGAALVQMAISRSREYLADAYAAEISQDPRALANAFFKLSNPTSTIDEEPEPATASLFIVNPLHGGVASWFSTHPPTEERIERLLIMTTQHSQWLPVVNDGVRQVPHRKQMRWPQGV